MDGIGCTREALVVVVVVCGANAKLFSLFWHQLTHFIHNVLGRRARERRVGQKRREERRSEREKELASE